MEEIEIFNQTRNEWNSLDFIAGSPEELLLFLVEMGWRITEEIRAFDDDNNVFVWRDNEWTMIRPSPCPSPPCLE